MNTGIRNNLTEQVIIRRYSTPREDGHLATRKAK